jgi:Trk K+ transport system NAD-binding subunit
MRAGADDVVSPFDSAGRQIASDILRFTGRLEPSHGTAFGKSLSPKWITVKEGSSMIHQTIHDLSLEMQRAVIGMRRDSCDLLMPDDQTQLLSGDRILVLDEGSDEMECAFPGQKKGRQLVIIDDNPVIVKLYTRKSFTF